jgi:hypothetical protein
MGIPDPRASVPWSLPKPVNPKPHSNYLHFSKNRETRSIIIWGEFSVQRKHRMGPPLLQAINSLKVVSPLSTASGILGNWVLNMSLTNVRLIPLFFASMLIMSEIAKPLRLTHSSGDFDFRFRGLVIFWTRKYRAWMMQSSAFLKGILIQS